MKFLFAGLCLIAYISTSQVFGQVKGDLAKVRQRVFDEIIQTEIDPDEIETLVKSIQPDGTWPGINYQDVSRTGFQHRNHLSNQVQLALAYKKKESPYYRNKKVKKTLEQALKHWTDNDYICDNWWHNQIGTPHALVTMLLIIGNELPKDLVAKVQVILGRSVVDAPGARPGGDRIKIAGIQAKNLLFNNDDQLFGEIIEIIEGEIKYVSGLGVQYGYGIKPFSSGFSTRDANGRGMQYDNSFHHRTDGVNNTISYGLSYAEAFVEWALYTTGTQYAFSDEKLEHLVNYFLDGICKTAVFGKYPDAGAKNRSLCRKGTLKAYSPQMAERLLATTTYRQKEIQEIADIRIKGSKPTLSHATFFWNSEHFSFQRPDFFTSVRMYSTRVHNMEQPYNSEGLLNHHRGDGTNHISLTGQEYFDIAPVFDYQKIPGATILQKPELPSEKEIQKLGVTEFAGAATDGKYAAVGFDFKSPHDPLCARKSWFFFDQEYVCLGAGISSKSEDSVATTLNQCLLNGEVTVSQSGRKSTLSKDERELEEVDWVYHGGIGYVFKHPTSLYVKNDEAIGAWFDISKQSTSSKEPVNLDVFKLWLDHGAKPMDSTYEYIVVPATSQEALEKEVAKNNINILANTPDVQAVEHTGLNIYQAVFYKGGEVRFSNGLFLKSDGPAIIMLRSDGGKVVAITVSDPNREAHKLHFSTSEKIKKAGEGFRAVWNERDQLSDISVEMPQGDFAGKSVTVDL